jgi:fluoroquinolone transport system permease protein
LKRLAGILACDARIQYRMGFHALGAIMAFAWMAALSRVPDAAPLSLPPIVILANLFFTVFGFGAWQVMRERTEGSFTMLDATPLRPHEYLASKAGSLVFPALLGNVAIVLAARGVHFHVAPLVAGIAAAGILFTLAGFILVSCCGPGKSILFPALLFALALAPPFLPGLGAAADPWIRIHPMQAPLSLLHGAFGDPSPHEMLYGAGYSLVWIAAGLVLAKRAFTRIRTASAGSG